LRGLLVVTTVSALSLGWVVSRAKRQQRAVAAVRAMGGHVAFVQYPVAQPGGNPEQPEYARQSRPGWAPEWIPDEYVERPKAVYVQGSADRDFSFLADLPTLETVCLLECPNFDDSDAAYLTSLKRLKLLSLIGSGITNAGLAELSKLPRLRILQLRGAHIDDAGIQHLRKLQSLTELDVFNTDISRQGVAQLAKDLPRCQLFQRP
jgi:hypothetical protein